MEKIRQLTAEQIAQLSEKELMQYAIYQHRQIELIKMDMIIKTFENEPEKLDVAMRNFIFHANPYHDGELQKLIDKDKGGQPNE